MAVFGEHFLVVKFEHFNLGKVQNAHTSVQRLVKLDGGEALFDPYKVLIEYNMAFVRRLFHMAQKSLLATDQLDLGPFAQVLDSFAIQTVLGVMRVCTWGDDG